MVRQKLGRIQQRPEEIGQGAGGDIGGGVVCQVGHELGLLGFGGEAAEWHRCQVVALDLRILRVALDELLVAGEGELQAEEKRSRRVLLQAFDEGPRAAGAC